MKKNKHTSPVKNNASINSEYIDGMRASAKLTSKTLDMVEENIKIGITTNEINKLVHDFILDHGATPAPLNYKGFPKSICTSINEVICHGMPDKTVIKNGDIINIDVTTILNGYHGDSSRTFLMGECSNDAKKIVAVAKQCLDLGINAAQPYNHIGDIGAAIQTYAHSQQCSVVEMFSGHGIGKKFHMEPQVHHFDKKGKGSMIIPGMFFTIEPMINLGVKDGEILADGWTAVTKDRKLSAQFEHTLFITEKGPEILTL